MVWPIPRASLLTAKLYRTAQNPQTAAALAMTSTSVHTMKPRGRRNPIIAHHTTGSSGFRRSGGNAVGEIVEPNQLSFGKDDRALDDVLQLADIAGPRILHERAQ